MNESKIINGLNDLLAKNYDSERGYETAAEKTNNQVLAAYFRGKASNRYTYGHQIKDIIREMGGDIDKGTSISGDLHNTWINVKAFFTGNSDESILDEVETGEEACVEEYDTFLQNPELPDSIRRIISYQRENIARALRKAERLEDSLA